MKCSGPMMIKNPAFVDQKSTSSTAGTQDRTIPVRCGKCEGCLKSNINNWSFRLEQEAKRSLYINFVTLTYDPLFVPLSPTFLSTLSKRDVQLFIKRLRKAFGDGIKYFAVGEYGSKSYRPHYHIILFNVPSLEGIHKAWTRDKTSMGNVHIGESISDGAIPYTLKYMYKKGLVPAFNGDDRLPEFRIMSKKLGDNYLSPAVIKWHLADLFNRQWVMFASGIKVALPRFYRDKLIALSGQPKELFRHDVSVYPTSEDNDYRTLMSRLQNEKNRTAKFEKGRNQNERTKI